jgi:hypothetical protein
MHLLDLAHGEEAGKATLLTPTYNIASTHVTTVPVSYFSLVGRHCDAPNMMRP